VVIVPIVFWISRQAGKKRPTMRETRQELTTGSRFRPRKPLVQIATYIPPIPPPPIMVVEVVELVVLELVVELVVLATSTAL
jgi:hypothetical protein